MRAGFFIVIMMDFKKHIFNVSEIVSLIKDIVETAFPSVLIKGEISNFKNYSGNLYFTLKDEISQLRCVIFRGYTRALKFSPKDGMSVIVQGTPTIYESRGDLQIVATYMEPLGIGSLKIAYEELKKRLSEKGYFDESRKKPIPAFPKTIGIVTSPKGAAIRDILNILKRRFLNLRIIIFPVKVQGEGAANEIANAINLANDRFFGVVDVLIVGRGGGSFEDLFAFNEEIVADAIYHSKIPIISAVGHETDFTISDFVADLRAPTPSAAAELVIKKKDELIAHIYHLYKRLTILIERHILILKKKVISEKRMLRSPRAILTQKQLLLIDYEAKLIKTIKNSINQRHVKTISLSKQLNLLSPVRSINNLQTKLKQQFYNLTNFIGMRIVKKKEVMSYVTGKLEMLSPLKILSRGYSITFTKNNKVLKDADKVAVYDEIKTRLQNGVIISTVVGKIKDT